MTTTDASTATAEQLVNDYVRALPPHLRRHLNRTARITIYLYRAVHTHGWTIPDLVAETTRDLGGIQRPGGLITFRLEKCADAPPYTAPAAIRRPLCGHCENGFTVDPTTMLPTGRCPCRTPQEATS